MTTPRDDDDPRPAFPTMDWYRECASSQWRQGRRSDDSKRPSVSIVTVAYNAASTLMDTLDSVRAIEGDGIEYIFVDGGSTDQTLTMLEDNMDLVSHWVSEKDRGIYDAFNKGIAKASGDLIRILNADDRIPADAVQWVMEAWEQDPTPRLLRGRMQVIDSAGAPMEVLDHRDTSVGLPAGFPVLHPTWFVPRTMYEAYGLYSLDYRIASDTEYLHRLLWHGAAVEDIDAVLADFRADGRSSDLSGVIECIDIHRRYLGRATSMLVFADAWLKKNRRTLLDRVLGAEQRVLLKKRVQALWP